MWTNLLFVVPIIFGPLLCLTGYIFSKHPPKKINHYVGYRTKISMKSQKLWDYAQTYAAKEMIRMGVIQFLLLFQGFIFKPKMNISIAIVAAEIVLISVILIIRVEMGLRKYDNSESNI